MAGLKRRASQVWPEEQGEQEHGLYSLHRMFDIVGTHLTHRDVRVLSFLFVDVIDDHERGLIRNGRDFLLALERQGRCDESNFRQVLQLLRIITRHDLLPYVTLKRRRAGEGHGAGYAGMGRTTRGGSTDPGSTWGCEGPVGGLDQEEERLHFPNDSLSPCSLPRPRRQVSGGDINSLCDPQSPQ